MQKIYRERTEKIAIFTSHDTCSIICQYLISEGNTCIVIVPKKHIDRKKIIDVQNYCREQEIPVLIHPIDKDELLLFCKEIISQKCTYAISWCYSQIIQKCVLDLFPSGIWNMHGGKIPEYRGTNILQWAIVNGEKELGVTWHLMDEKIDHGPLLKEGTVVINDTDTAIILRDKAVQLGFELFRKLWEDAENNGISPYEVDMSKGKYWRARNLYDGIINADMSEHDIINLLRAQCPPWPEPIYYDKASKVYRINGIAGDSDIKNTILFENDKCRLRLYAALEQDEKIINNVKQICSLKSI